MSAERLEPDSAAAAAELTRAAAAARRSLLPCGRHTRLRRHFPDAAPAAWLSLRRLDRIRSVDADDQTCVVEPGVSEHALNEAVAPHGLELGAAAPCAREGTLGGLFLAPDVSLLRAPWGPPRDQVLGASWLLSDGTPVRSGARVVKSVAGYDVTRLFLGSRGRLAACTELTLRLRPRPRAPRWYRVPPVQLRAWLHPDPRQRVPARLLFQVDGALWAQTDGVDVAGALHAGRVDAAEGLAAFERCRAAFGAAAQRAALPFSAAAALAGLAVAADLLAASFAADDAGAAAAALGLEAGLCRVVPQPAPSPWLERLQQACAPAAVPFGGGP
ncbi:MAG: FAD-binding oxidoreductase [Planctomycetota bacterium]|nr:MAG: FAD-binding oxidoreductase [Planctomycetota bacterium]